MIVVSVVWVLCPDEKVCLVARNRQPGCHEQPDTDGDCNEPLKSPGAVHSQLQVEAKSVTAFEAITELRYIEMMILRPMVFHFDGAHQRGDTTGGLPIHAA